jgi:hypothetical protein
MSKPAAAWLDEHRTGGTEAVPTTALGEQETHR